MVQSFGFLYTYWHIQRILEGKTVHEAIFPCLNPILQDFYLSPMAPKKILQLIDTSFLEPLSTEH